MLQVGEILHHDYEEGRPPSPERPTSPSMTFAAGMTAGGGEEGGGEPLKESLLMGPDYTMPYTMQHRGATGERPPSPEAKLFQSRAAALALPSSDEQRLFPRKAAGSYGRHYSGRPPEPAVEALWDRKRAAAPPAEAAAAGSAMVWAESTAFDHSPPSHRRLRRAVSFDRPTQSSSARARRQGARRRVAAAPPRPPPSTETATAAAAAARRRAMELSTPDHQHPQMIARRNQGVYAPTAPTSIVFA